MADLVSASAVMLGVSLLLGCVAWAGTRHLPRRTRQVALFGLVVVLLLFLWKFRGQLVMAQLFPFSSAVILGDLAIPLLATMIGLLVAIQEIPAWRRAVICLFLATAACYPIYFVFAQRPPVSGIAWDKEVCLQTSMATCGPAAAATLLAYADIAATEGEMAHLCRTGERGATLLGIYRGLKLKTAGSRWNVAVTEQSIDDLLAAQRWPVLLRVELKRGETDPRYERFFGWTPGVGHVVIIFYQLRNGLFEVGDPSIGREYWNIRDLEVLWHGDGLRLVDRQSRGETTSAQEMIPR